MPPCPRRGSPQSPQGFAHFPRSFPHRYVNCPPAGKIPLPENTLQAPHSRTYSGRSGPENQPSANLAERAGSLKRKRKRPPEAPRFPEDCQEAVNHVRRLQKARKFSLTTGGNCGIIFSKVVSNTTSWGELYDLEYCQRQQL